MFRGQLQGGGDPQTGPFIETALQPDVLQLQPAGGQRAGLVENDVAGPRQGFQRMAAGGQHTQARQAPRGGGQRSGGGQRQGTGAGHHQHRQYNPEGFFRLMLPPPPADYRSQQQNHSDEDAGDAICQPSQARLFRLGTM